MIDEQESVSSGRNRVFSENLIDEFKRSPDLNEIKLFRSEKNQQSIYDELSTDYSIPDL